MPRNERLQLLADTFEAMDVMVAVLDRNMNFLSVNRAFASSRGEQPAHFAGKNYFALYPDTEKQASFLSVARTGKAFRHWKNVVPDKHNGGFGLRYWDWCLSPVRDHRGRIASLVLSVVDDPEWMSAAAAPETNDAGPQPPNQTVEDSPVQYAEPSVSNSAFTKAVLDTVGSIVIVIDRQGRILLFNHACEQLTGYRAEEALGRRFWDFLLLREEREPVKAKFDQLCRGFVPNSHENYWLTKDGNRRWLAFTNTALRDASGDVNYIVATGVDMTERRQAEAELRRSEQQFRLLAENINELFWLGSPDRKVMYYVSPAFETIWGRPCSDQYADPKVFMETTPEEDRAKILAHQAEQAKGHFRDDYQMEFRIRRPDGEMRWISSRYVPVRDEAGHVFRVAGVCADITERKQAERERLQRERIQRDALVREVHHRIKNSLQGVVGLLRLHSHRHPELAEVFQKAVAQVATVALVHGLQGKEGTERVALCDMCEAIAVNLMAPLGGAARLQVGRHSPVPFLVGEREAVPLALVMNELMFNALKHSTPAGSAQIRVDIEADADGVIVRLRNTGAQLPEGLDVMGGSGLGTGLGLVRTLLPKGASVTLRAKDGWIETELRVGASAGQLLGTESRIA